MDQLDRYLEGLVKQAEAADQERARVDGLSFEELAHMAGIKLAESVCSKCGGTMEKGSAMYKCSGCGGMKKHARNVFVEGGKRIPLKGAKRLLERTGLFKVRKGSSPVGTRVPAGKAEAKMTENMIRARTDKITGLSGAGKAVAGTTGVAGVGIGAKALHSKLKKKDEPKTKEGAVSCPGGKIKSKGKGRGLGFGGTKGPIGTPIGSKRNAAKVKKAFSPLQRALIEGGSMGARALPSEMQDQTKKVRAAQDPDKPGAETATGESLKKSGSGVGSLLAKLSQEGVEYPVEAKWMPGAQAATHAITEPGKAEQHRKALQSSALKGLGYGALIGGGTGLALGGVGGFLARAGSPKHRLMQSAVAAGLGGLGGALGGTIAGPSIASESKLRDILREKGIHRTGAFVPTHRFTEEASGKYLSPEGIKTSAPINLTKGELMEAVEEAKSREDIPGRARRMGILGGAGGGVAGGLTAGLGGYGVGRMLQSRFPGLGRVAPIGGALLGTAAGGVGGGMLGSSIGRREGAEEAAADLLVSRLRQSAAGQRGAMAGYLAGLRRGLVSSRPMPTQSTHTRALSGPVGGKNKGASDRNQNPFG